MKVVNERLKRMELSGGLYEIFQKALEMESQGRKIYHMEIGKPDFDSPDDAKKATIKALNDGFVHYTSMFGINELRQAIAEKEYRENNIIADPNSEIMVTAGACEALMSIMLAIMDPGDEIIIPSPYFSAYKDMAMISGVKIVEVPLKFENEFILDVDDVKDKITDKTKALLINTPNNPTGAVIGLEDLKKIAELAISRDLLVISDETYDQFLFEGRHHSISTLDGMKERTIIINSASKTFSMTGWRIGYAIAPAHIIKYLNKVHQNMSTCATSFVQVGAAHAFRYSKGFTKNMVHEFKKRRDIVVEGLSHIEKIQFVVPKGAFYIFPRIKDINLSSTDFCKRLLEETGIAMVPGNAFGDSGEGFIRIAYPISQDELKESMKIFKDFVERL
ncbi:MAG TPA: hypothetical protein DCS12_01825 [Clostridiales bacterium]|nr:hypothetical protein [Clostridiales bacterium]